MPRYYAVASGQQAVGRGTIVRSTVRPRLFEVHRWIHPIGAFDMPMDTMTRDAGLISMTEEELDNLLETAGRPYWVGRVY